MKLLTKENLEDKAKKYIEKRRGRVEDINNLLNEAFGNRIFSKVEGDRTYTDLLS